MTYINTDLTYTSTIKDSLTDIDISYIYTIEDDETE